MYVFLTHSVTPVSSSSTLWPHFFCLSLPLLGPDGDTEPNQMIQVNLFKSSSPTLILSAKSLLKWKGTYSWVLCQSSDWMPFKRYLRSTVGSWTERCVSTWGTLVMWHPFQPASLNCSLLLMGRGVKENHWHLFLSFLDPSKCALTQNGKPYSIKETL